MEYDSNRDVIYNFGGNYPESGKLHRFDIEKFVWEELNPKGDGPGLAAKDGPGLAFDPINDVLLIYNSGQLWAYHPKDDRWEAIKTKTHPQDRGYVFGRFRYDPINKGVWLHNWESNKHTTWFFRYAKTVK